MTSSQVPHLSEPQFPHLTNDGWNSTITQPVPMITLSPSFILYQGREKKKYFSLQCYCNTGVSNINQVCIVFLATSRVKLSYGDVFINHPPFWGTCLWKKCILVCKGPNNSLKTDALLLGTKPSCELWMACKITYSNSIC